MEKKQKNSFVMASEKLVQNIILCFSDRAS